MRRVNESLTILQRVVTTTGLPSARVEQVVTALRDVADETFLDGYSIFVPPFVLAYPNDPVAALFNQRFDTADPADIDAWFVGESEATARWLGLSEDEYLRHPVASGLTVVVRLFDALGLGAESPDDHDDVLAIAEAWFDTFDKPRTYHFSRVGLESDLERWLAHHPEKLTDLGYPVRLRHQQFVLPDKRRPDLVFDLTEDARAVGTLVVELKAVGGYVEAVDQLAGYMTAIDALGQSAGILRGLLVADGFTPEVVNYAADQGIDTLTLSALGYRAALATAALPASRADTNHTPTITEESMTEPTLSDRIAAARRTAQGEDDEPAEAITPTPTEEPATGVYQMFHGMSMGMGSDQQEPQATLVFGDNGICQWVSHEDAFATFVPVHLIYALTLDQIAGVMNSRVFVPIPEDDPEYVDAMEAAHAYVPVWEAGALATAAAADFLRAVWESRKGMTVVPPRTLANYLQRNPHELQGDDDLPEHIQSAADALEGLPRAVLDWEPPEYYDARSALLACDMRPHLSGVWPLGGVVGGGDVEQVEDLLL